MQGRILILDDNPGLHERLVARGLEVDAAANADEAFRLAGQAAYDAVLVNPRIPVPGGQGPIGWMRERAPDTLILAISASGAADEVRSAIRQGAFDVLPGQWESDDLFLRRIEQALAYKQLRNDRDRLQESLQSKDRELADRLGQLELAHSILQAQAVAIQMDLSRAMRIQRGLLPRTTPRADRISAAAAYHPMAKVGGDLYDVFPLDDKRVGCFIADTSGHGISSAMLTVFLKHAIQSVTCAGGGMARLPGEMLRELNRTILSEAFSEGLFVSMTCLVLDVEMFSAAYSSAGHRPLFVRRNDGSLERLHRPAPVLGVNPFVAYSDGEIVLEPGELIVFHTDGITEARNVEGDSFGEERLVEAIRGAEPHADTIVAAVEQARDAFRQGAPRVDDATLLVLGMEPQRAPLWIPDEPAPQPAAGGPQSVKVLTAYQNGHRFIALSGTGSWRESQQVFDLCRQPGVQSITLDLLECTHLDSTFLGVLHNIATTLSDASGIRFEIQNVPRELLKTMSELGLIGVLMHFRPKAVPLPADMAPVEGGAPAGEELGRLLLWAHEALVEADPRNADRFAAVLQVLHDQACGASRNAQRTHAS